MKMKNRSARRRNAAGVLLRAEAIRMTDLITAQKSPRGCCFSGSGGIPFTIYFLNPSFSDTLRLNTGLPG